MKSIQKIDAEEKEIKILINSLKNVLTDVPYDYLCDDCDISDSDLDKSQ